MMMMEILGNPDKEKEGPALSKVPGFKVV